MGTRPIVLAELGIENLHPHSDHERGEVSQWVLDDEFIPVPGHTYHIAYGKIPFGGTDTVVSRRVRIDGPGEWFDLDEQKPIDRNLMAYPVRAFRQID